MYSVDGIALHNPGMGWKFRGPSKPLSDLVLQRTSLRVPGMPGVVASVDDALASLDAPTPTLMVQTPRANYEALLGLLADAQVMSLTGVPNREAPIELLSTSHEGFGNGDAVVDVTATVRLPGVFWRDANETTISNPVSSASVAADVWSMTGLVTDAVIRVGPGGFAGLALTSRIASLVYTPAVPSGSYFRYHCASGRAYVTTSAAWSGGTEVSGLVVADGPGDKFAIFPSRVSPWEKVGRIQVATTSRAAGTVIEVRGKGAHLA